MEVNPALNADAIVDVPNGDDPTIEVNSSDTNFNDALQGNVNEITIPMLPSTVTESPSRMPATISVQELLKSVAQQLRWLIKLDKL